MICPYCKALNDDAAEACFTCGRALSALTQGSVIANRFVIESVLGKGGMGMVYRAHDRMLDETVAIKVLRAEFANTAEMLRRFKQEIKLARRVSHKNVCRIHGFDEDKDTGLRYISMEYVEGKDVKQLARDEGGFLEVDEAYDIAIQAADGLQAIHDVGIVHRDLKASNIMRDLKGHVRLMDFGIAKMEAMDRSTGGLTIEGQTMGTPEYMSPEQCMAEKPITGRSDIYALGVVIYELFTGTVPFRGDTPVATLFKHINEAVPFEGPLAARIPLAAVPVLRKALAKLKEDRFGSAARLAEALREARQKTNEAAAADSAPTARVASVLPPGVYAATTPSPTPPDRRRATRLETPVNFMLRRVGSAGKVLQEERTVAENIGRGGARVFTSISSMAPGDIVHLEQVDGPFRTRAEVRGTYVGKDRVRRLNLRFLDSPAPDYLVKVDENR